MRQCKLRKNGLEIAWKVTRKTLKFSKVRGRMLLFRPPLQLCSPQFKFVGTGPKLLSIFKTFEDDFRKVRLLFGVSKRDKCHNFKCIFLKAERKISWFQEHSSWSISFPLRYLTKSGHYLQCKPSKRIWTACYLGLIISNSLGLAYEQVQIFAVIWTVEKCTKSLWLKLFLTM